MGRKVTAILGPLKLLAPLCWKLLSEYLVLSRFLFSVVFCLVGLQNLLVRAYCSWLRFDCFAKNTSWNRTMRIASLPSTYQTIRCLGIWRTSIFLIIIVEVWIVHLKREVAQNILSVRVAFLEGSSGSWFWDLCWPCQK